MRVFALLISDEGCVRDKFYETVIQFVNSNEHFSEV